MKRRGGPFDVTGKRARGFGSVPLDDSAKRQVMAEFLAKAQMPGASDSSKVNAAFLRAVFFLEWRVATKRGRAKSDDDRLVERVVEMLAQSQTSIYKAALAVAQQAGPSHLVTSTARRIERKAKLRLVDR